MTRICRLLLSVTLFVVVQPYIADAAIENPMTGEVTLVWTAQYTPFSWKFSVDPPPYENGKLTVLYDPTKATFVGFNPASTAEVPLPPPEYEILGFDNNGTGVISDIQFVRDPQIPSTGNSTIVFNMEFADPNQEGLGSSSIPPVITVLADLNMNDGFNYPEDSQAPFGIDFGAAPAITQILQASGCATYSPESTSLNGERCAIPEPGSFVLAWLGTLGVLAFRRRR